MGAGTIATSSLSPFAALRAFRRDPIRLLEELADLGDVVRLRIPRADAFLLNHPDLVREVLVTDHRSFHKGPTIQAAKMLLGDSLLTTEEETHRRQRRLIQPLFHHDRIAGYGEVMVRRADAVAASWRGGETLDVHAEMARLTLGIVGEALFGTDVDDQRSMSIRRALTDALAMFDRMYSPLFRLLVRLPTPAMRRYHRIEADLRGAIEAMIAARRSQGSSSEAVARPDKGSSSEAVARPDKGSSTEAIARPNKVRPRDDLLSLLLGAREDGAGMTDEQVRDEALTLFLAGHETTANALAWTWWWLDRTPEAEDALHAELDAVLGGRPPTADDVPRLPVTEAVLSESIRLRPPAWAIGRRVIAEHRAGAVAIPSGAVVVVSPWLLHHDPRWWPDSGNFRLDRWTPEAKAVRPRGAYLPFGAGPRMCIGEPFAWLEGVLVLATIARRWRLRLEPGHPVELQAAVTLRPRSGIRMVPERRGVVRA